MHWIAKNTDCIHCSHTYHTLNYYHFCGKKKKPVFDNEPTCEDYNDKRNKKQ